MLRIGPRVGVNPDTLRGWVKQARVDAGEIPGRSSEEAGRVRELEREVKELKACERDLASGFEFLRAGARPATAVGVEFIDTHKGRFGVVPICRVLSEHGVGIAPSSYYAYLNRPASWRALRDAELMVEIERVYQGPGRSR